MTSSFATAMNTFGFTWNGAVSQGTPDASGKTSGRISLFFKAVRGIEKSQLETYLSEAAKEDLKDTIVLAFMIRDCRGGKGEREIGRWCLEWLRENYSKEYNLVNSLIPDYGRWDDLLLGNDADLQLVSAQLRKDLEDMNEGKSVSLCAKWAPTENDSLDRNMGIVKKLCAIMEVKPRVYRKTYISPLRQYLNVVERYMCSGNWEMIDFNKVPSQAMHRLKKALERHNPESFHTWQSGLSTGKTKVCASQLDPHQVLKKVRVANEETPVETAQWKVLEDKARESGSFNNCLFVVDVSGSMYGMYGRKENTVIPIDVAVSLGLLCAGVTEGTFHNHIITFSDNPSFFVVKGDTLLDKFNHIKGADWGMSTNIQKVFDLILGRGKSCNLKQEDMPTKIFIISDMQFNDADSGYGTNYEVIDKKYKESGYTRPQIIFWNVNGSSKDFPVTFNDKGTAMISGFSTSVMKSVLNGGEFSPYGILRTSLDDKRYDKVREALAQ